jgi:peroxiredoxin
MQRGFYYEHMRRLACLAQMTFVATVAGCHSDRTPVTRTFDDATQLAVGMYAPGFTLWDERGSRHRLSDYRGKKVLVGFCCGCGLCHRLARNWEERFGGLAGLQVLVIAEFGPSAAEDFRERTGIQFPLLLDPFGQTAKRYDSLSCPRCWLVSETGRVIYCSSGPTDDLAIVSERVHQLISAESRSAAS